MMRNPRILTIVLLAAAMSGRCGGSDDGSSADAIGARDVASDGVTGPTCTSTCPAEEAKQCVAGGASVCADLDDDGCLEWSPGSPCPPGQACSGGACVPSCQAQECTAIGAKGCDAQGRVVTCDDFDGDGCLDWGNPQACATNLVCSQGNCALTCTGECTVIGARRCEGSRVVTCDDRNADGCMEWGDPTECAPDVCSQGACRTTCVSECTADGATRCSGGAVQTCGDYNGDACLEWGTPEGCPTGQACSGGSCREQCVSECTVDGAVRCELDAVATCGDPDGDGCLGWGTPVPCAEGEACSAGACSATCSDECTTDGAVRCDVAGRVETCGDHNGDGCLGWGTGVACPVGSTCANGACRATCADDCPAEGARRCVAGASARFEVCGDANADGCLEWGSAQACPDSQVCSAGACADTCSNDCDTDGAVRCADDAVSTCGDYNGDGCLEWGTAAPCAAFETCAADACAQRDPPAGLTISELLVDSQGFPDSEAYLELHGPAGVDLAGLRLVGIDGGTGDEYRTLELAGALGADGLFVIAHPDATWAAVDLRLAGVDLQNGPDSVQLWYGGALVDAVGYGVFTASDTFAGEGRAAPDIPVDRALARDAAWTDTEDNAADFAVTREPTPGAGNQIVADDSDPVAVLSCPSGGPAETPLTFDASASSDAEDGAVSEATFRFGDGSPEVSGAQLVVQHAFAAQGEYTVEVVVVDAGGRSDTASCTVSIGAPDPCGGVVCTTPPPDACEGDALRRYRAQGLCQAGACSYPSALQGCPDGCSQAACVAPSCGADRCDSPPDDECLSASVLQVHAPLGTCEADACTYQAREVTCSEGCFGGRCIAGSWTVEDPPIGRPSLNSYQLAVDGLDRPHVGICANAGTIQYRTRDAFGWRSVDVDPDLGRDCRVAIALGTDGAPHLAWYDPTNADVRYGTPGADGEFDLDLVQNQGDVGQGVGMAISAAGEIAIGYLSVDGGVQLTVARGAAGSWAVEDVGPVSGFRDPVVLLAYDSAGDLHVAAGEGVSHARRTTPYNQPPLYWGVRRGGAWQLSTLNEDGLLFRSGLEVTGARAAVAFGVVTQVGNNDQVRYAVGDGADGAARDDLVQQVGNLLSPAPLGQFEAESRPGIAYSDLATILRRDAAGFWRSGSAPIDRLFAIEVVTAPDGRARFLGNDLEYITPAVCAPDCAGRLCGDDSCGGSCGDCPDGSCGPDGQCAAWTREGISLPQEALRLDNISMAVAGDGAVHAIWRDGFVRVLQRSPGGAWSSSLIEGSGGLLAIDALVVDAAGIPHFPLFGTSPAGIHVFSGDADPWTKTLLAGSSTASGYPAMALGPDGTWHVVHTSRGYNDGGTYYAGVLNHWKRSPSGETEARVVARPVNGDVSDRGGGTATAMHVAVDATGAAHVVWVNSLSYTNLVSLRVALDRGGDFVEEIVEESYSGSTGVREPAIAIGASDTVYLYDYDTDARLGRFRSRPSAGGDWVVETVHADMASQTYRMAIDRAGRAWVLQEATDSLQLFRREAAGDWRMDTLPLHGRPDHAALGFDADGAPLVLVWVSPRDATNGQLRLLRGP